MLGSAAMRDAAGLSAFLTAMPGLAGALQAVAALALPEAWIGAGFIRNAAWDALSGLPFGSNPPSDIDVVWFDPAGTVADDLAVEARLGAAMPGLARPGLAWSVRNQARMHGRNGDAPYPSTLDAVAHWPETATAVVARWTPRGVELAAPWGLEDLLGLVLRPTPGFAPGTAKHSAFLQRAAARRWQARWPRLVLHADPPARPALPEE